MQVTSSSNPAAQIGALESASKSRYQDKDFSFVLDQALQSSSAGNNSATSKADSVKTSSNTTSVNNGWELSVTASSMECIAVGTVGPDGKVVPYSQQQIQSEQDAVSGARLAAYDSALQNFLTLSQAGGQLGAGTLTDHQEFTTANGLVGGRFDFSFSLKAPATSTA